MGNGPFGKPCDRKKIIGTTGDASPLDYGGGMVYAWKEYITWEFWYEPQPEDESLWDENKYEYTVYRTDIPVSVLREYCKAKNPSSRHMHNWVDVADVASMVGMEPLEWAKLACSRNPMERVRCLEDICSYYGAENLDSYPITLTGAEIKRRWKNHMRRGSWKTKR